MNPLRIPKAALAAGRVRAGRLVVSAQGEPQRRRVLWALVAAVLVGVPVGFNVWRQDGFEASVKLFPRPIAGHPPVRDVGYYRNFLEDQELRLNMGENTGYGYPAYSDSRFRAIPKRHPILLTVHGESPREAQVLVNALAPQIAGATQRQLAAELSANRRDLERRLERPGVGPSERRELEYQIARLRRIVARPPPARIVLGPPAAEPRLERWPDRVADAMPGDFPGRPSPVWAGLAGLLVAVTLWAIALALVPPGSSRPPAAPVGRAETRSER